MRKTLYVVLSVLVLLLGLASVGFYVYEVVALETPWTENLFRLLVIVFGCVGVFIRFVSGLRGSSGRASVRLEKYEAVLSDVLEDSFSDRSALRKKLLKAVRYVYENRPDKGLTILLALRDEAKTPREQSCLLYFIAKCYDAMALPQKAEDALQELLRANPRNGRACNNLANIYASRGDLTLALHYYDAAAAIDAEAWEPALNSAVLCFEHEEYDTAVNYAEQALEREPHIPAALGLLCVIWAIKGDEEKRDRYFRQAVAAGFDADGLLDTVRENVPFADLSALEDEEL